MFASPEEGATLAEADFHLDHRKNLTLELYHSLELPRALFSLCIWLEPILKLALSRAFTLSGSHPRNRALELHSSLNGVQNCPNADSNVEGRRGPFLHAVHQLRMLGSAARVRVPSRSILLALAAQHRAALLRTRVTATRVRSQRVRVKTVRIRHTHVLCTHPLPLVFIYRWESYS